jgi:DNA-binding response OmpR family regulator
MMKKHMSIMVVDDEEAILQLLERTLEQEGYDVVLASDGSSALRLVERHSLHLVILDIMMPGLNGFQVLRLMRQRSNIPVMMLTARQEAETARDALNLGADDYIRKPFHTRELLARIRAKLRRAEPEITVPIKGE